MVFGFRRSGARKDQNEWEALLRRVVDPLPDPDGLTGYVLTGSSPHVLQNVPGTLLFSVTGLEAFYAGFAERDSAVLWRWGRLLDALASQRRSSLGWGAVGGQHWTELFLAGMQASVPLASVSPLTLAHLVDGIAHDGAGAADLLAAAFAAPRSYSTTAPAARQMLARLPGFADAMRAHAEVASEAVTNGPVEQRILALETVAALPDDALAPFAEAMAQAASGSSERVREQARPLLVRSGADGLTALRGLALEGKPDERGRALEMLWAHPQERAFAEQAAEADRAGSVRALTDVWRATAGAEEEPLQEMPSPMIVWGVSSEDAERIVAATTSALMSEADGVQSGRPHQASPKPLRKAAELAPKLRSALTARTAPSTGDASGGSADWQVRRVVFAQLLALARRGQVTVPAALTTLATFGILRNANHRGHGYYAELELFDAVHDATGGPDLLSLQVMLDECGLLGAELVWHGYTREGSGLGRHWPAAQVWPFVARNLDFLAAHSRASNNDYFFDESAFVAALATFPDKPQRVREALYERALGPRKTERRPAQDALVDDPQRTTRVVAALADGKADSRVIAAQWLARIADPSAQEPLEKAFAKEKQDAVRAALLDALEALGCPVEHYLDATTLLGDAEKAAAKGMQKGLEWLPWELLPEVHWSASGDLVPRVVVQYFVAQAVRAKSPEPNAILRKYAALMVESERRELARVLLELWLAEDTRPIPRPEAERDALNHAGAMHMYLSQPGQQYAGMTVEQIAAASLPMFLKRPAGSAIASKGVLAVAAACGGVELLAPTERYLREWYGMRAAQCKALVAMLAWVDDVAATQLLLAIGNRFRTKGIQEEASRQVLAVAERRGWTLAELADRTVPTVGFENGGTRSFDYGTGRSFTARLLPDLSIELRDDDGGVLKTLPPARKSDDEDAVAAAKKGFTSAKKELKAVANHQAERLQEALYIGRGWGASDWTTYLAAHPVLRLLVSRLVWIAMVDESVAVSFRLLEDGTQTDANDDAVELDPAWEIRLAHDSNLPAEDVERWLEHLADYEVQPLFTQLGREILVLPPEQRREQRLTDIEGHLLRAYVLRGWAGKRGWTRGPTEDGGWFYSYIKRFPTCGVTAVLDFSGNPLPEQDRTVALQGLSFEQEAREGQRRPLPLAEVPVVLLSETWHEVRQLAASGSGFDPDWEKTTEFR